MSFLLVPRTNKFESCPCEKHGFSEFGPQTCNDRPRALLMFEKNIIIRFRRLCFQPDNSLNGHHGHHCSTPTIPKISRISRCPLVGRILNFLSQKPSRGYAQQLARVSLQSDQRFRDACGTYRQTFIFMYKGQFKSKFP